MSDSVRPHRRQPTRLLCPWDSPGKNTGVGCHFLLQCMKVKSESKVAQSCPTLSDPMDCSPPGSSIHGIFQARALEWVAVAFSSPDYADVNLSYSFSCCMEPHCVDVNHIFYVWVSRWFPIYYHEKFCYNFFFFYFSNTLGLTPSSGISRSKYKCIRSSTGCTKFSCLGGVRVAFLQAVHAPTSLPSSSPP